MCVNDPLLLISKSQGLLDHPFFMLNDTDIISDPCFPEGYQLSVSGPLSQQFAHLRLFPVEIDWELFYLEP